MSVRSQVREVSPTPARLRGGGEPITSVGTYVLTTVILIVLTVINVGLSFVDLRGFNSALALLIASIEVLIMAMTFMHLRWSPSMTRLVGIAALLWLAILMVGTLDDVLTRGWLPVPGK